jgi:IclR family acetate operon transcriptional repressor
VRCVAAPVLDFRGDIAGSIGISGPTSRVPKSRLAELGAAARDAATEATRSLGGIPLAMTGSDVIARRDASGTE